MRWAAATDYEEVSVPRVGKVSARRWRDSAVEDLVERTSELLERDEQLRIFRRICRKFGKEYALTILDGKDEPEPPSVVPHVSNASIDDSGIPIGVKDALSAFLKQTHAWGIRTLKTEFEIDLGACELEVSWHQISVREFWSPFNFESSRGGRKNGKYFVRIMAGVRMEEVREFTALVAPLFRREEYDFIADDPEIGSCEGLNAFHLILRTYLHEISHAAALWLKDKKKQLPDQVISLEEAKRSATPLKLREQIRSGHDLTWSALYRWLTRLAIVSPRERLKTSPRRRK